MNIFEIVVYGVCRTIIGHYKVTNSSKEEAMFVATQMLLSDGVDIKDVVSIETSDMVYSKFAYSVQIYSTMHDREFIVDGCLLADEPQRARNFAQLQANAIVDETDNRKFGLKVMGVSVQPILEVVI